MPYEIMREGALAPAETTQTIDHALFRAKEMARKADGYLRFFVVEKERTGSRVRAFFHPGGAMSWARACDACKGTGGAGGWCGPCQSSGFVEAKT